MAKFNFRSSSGYVTDGAGETYVAAEESYPTVRDGLTFGWDSTGSQVQERDRSTGVDTRLAGCHFTVNTNGYSLFSTNSGSGTFDVTLAIGQPVFASSNCYLEIVEINSSQVVQSVLQTVVSGVSVSGSNWRDANGALHTSAANWVSNNTPVQVTVASGNHLGIRIGDPAGAASGDAVVGHFAYEAVAASFAIDSTDASMQRNGTFDVAFSNPATTPTTGNTSLSSGGDTLTCTGVTGSDPYTATFSVGDLSKQVDATGYDWTLTVDAETDTTGNIPLTIQTGWTKKDLVDPVTTNASLLFGATGDTPVTGGDLEYIVTSTLDAGVSFDVAADGVWTVTEATDGDWTTDITVDRRVVQANGTIGSTDTLTLSAAEPSAPVMPADTSVNVAENSTTVGTFAASSGSPAPTYSLSGPDAALFSINSSTAAVTFDSAPDYESDPLSYSITVTATNSEGSDSQNITVNVTNVVETPVLASTLALNGTVDSAFSRTLSIQSGDAATSWTITGGADQASYSINSSGVLSRDTENDTAEDEVVTVTATNSAGTSNTQTVTITYSAASYVGTNSIALNIGISI